VSISTAVGEVVELSLERAATGGAVGRTASGQVVFARHGLPGERVVVTISETTKSFARGDVTNVLVSSAERVEPRCPYAGAHRCGGCDLQHATTEAQLDWKSAVSTEHFERIAGVNWRVEVAEVPGGAQGSRTRLRCGVDESGELALRRSRSHDLFTIDTCWLADPRLAKGFDTTWTNAREVELRAIGDAAAFGVKRWPQVDPVVFETTTLDDEPLSNASSTVTVRGHEFRVGPLSFWQSHRQAPELLLDEVLSHCDLSEGDRAVDLFCGVGLFTVPMAHRVGPRGRVSGVESSLDACDDAEVNGAGLRQLAVRNWRVTPRAINDVVGAGDVVVLDPPRSGAGKAVMMALAARRPRRIVYVSCDAATMARDVKAALEGDYELRELRGFDLFPMTEHVELVAVLDARR
jgi:tRNA/tmRNA/rRNA uracil-C5-methylase (TrmA/RlmC/RlmD family)